MELRRIENFRKGDRAEKLGIFLLQSFCAIAEVPRQEDFGLVDAVATLLRRQEQFLIAEDSFLVQFKSRTETVVELLDGRFKALIALDLPLFLGRVDLRDASLELHTLGLALAHPDINDCSGVVAYLRGTPEIVGLKDNVLHIPFDKPILRVGIGDIESSEFTNKAYVVLKEWLNFERWNRRYRKSGLGLMVTWETNEVPRGGGTSLMWNPAKAKESLQEFVPFIALLGCHARSNAELRNPTLKIITWLCNHGVDADPGGVWAMVIVQAEIHDILGKALNEHPDADLAYTFQIVGAGEDRLDFWLRSRNREGTGGSVRYHGNLAQIREKGFVARVDVLGSHAQVNLGYSEEWLSSRQFKPTSPPRVEIDSELVRSNLEVFMLRKVPEGVKPVNPVVPD